MKLHHIRTENFAGLPDRTYALATKSGAIASTVLITGAPGSGKTGLLAAIVAAKEHIAAYGRKPSLAARAADPARPVVLETAWGLPQEEQGWCGSKDVVVTAEVRVGSAVSGGGDHRAGRSRGSQRLEAHPVPVRVLEHVRRPAEQPARGA